MRGQTVQCQVGTSERFVVILHFVPLVHLSLKVGRRDPHVNAPKKESHGPLVTVLGAQFVADAWLPSRVLPIGPTHLHIRGLL